MNDLLVRAARGERTERPPVWLMRQAGRHLPEYREIREEYDFLEAVTTPEIAAEITLQPYERYRTDGVVMFSDILTVLEPLGFAYHIESGTGPVVDAPISGPDDVPQTYDDVGSSLAYVGDLLDRLDARVGDETGIIGFAGGPFTLASYAVAGRATRNHYPLRQFTARHPEAFADLLSIVADAVREFLQYQVAHGADVVQLFDTYAGVLPPADYQELILPLHRKILADLEVPTIVFVRNMGGRLDQLTATGADVIGLDWTVEMGTAREQLGDRPVQGNLDPSVLFADPETVRERTREVIEQAGPRGHVLNLGHGLHRDTPIEGVEAFVETAKSIER
ncbi:Uroporphyrinogen decarboxylase protein [Halorhabdus tiamatea SARL4B]|uniref:Uroporphyrinogen decarboxylase n=1 Tax=Halorhabdus tiamatea SARL4B TaxID=1033806 RepID=F7PKR1_9EURY|nr:uroporphyrinogen decarboxylase [Halorhabdus tiamatea]ERJ06178.1 Uroporphyrinogen decarboxylase protein [Halorhabdus tiamatea SARL4B]CCQ34045.1 uroporphyrinogen decarboxylase [Halorhabdus tiamatea SARL4B]